MEDEFDAAFEAESEAVPVEQVEVKQEVPAEPTPEPQAPAPEAPLELTERADGSKAEPGYIPIAALLDTRDKLKAAEALASAREREIALLQGQQQQPPVDMFEDPEGFQAAINRQILSAKLDLSEENARDKFGDETVEAARDWFVTQPQAFQQDIMSKRHPYGAAVKEFQRVQALDKLGTDTSDIDQFLAWKAAQQAAPIVPAAVIPNQGSSLPPRSLASAPSAGGLGLTPDPDPDEAFGAAFK